MASLASHFPSKRRILHATGVPSEETLAKLPVLQSEAEAASATAFRFDFDVEELVAADTSSTTKNKNKKKKKKNKKNKSKNKIAEHEAESGAAETVSADHEEAVKAPQVPKVATVDASTVSAPPSSDRKKDKASSLSATVRPTSDAPSFVKLRKPTSSDSEVMKMQLRYGRGRRNLAAIAQRERQKQQQQQKLQQNGGEAARDAQTAASDHPATTSSSSTSFQFNFSP